MDVLNAELRWIENRCYRLLSVKENVKHEHEDDIQSSISFKEDDNYDPDLPILHHGDKFYITIHVPAELLCCFRGKYFKRQKEIEQQYGASLVIPLQRNATAGITVTGSTNKIVSDTYRRIEYEVLKARFRKDFTHFISLPINSSEIKESFLKFKNEVLEKRARGVDESIFQNPNKLHVTITPLVLLDERDKQNAIAILKNCTDNILKHVGVKQLVVYLKGIEYMNDDPAEVDVLYAKLKEVDDDNHLQIIADSILKEFVTSNLAKQQNDKVKLHITIMNTLFREHQDTDSPRITFDARGILKDFSDYDFGKIVLSELHISVRYSTAVTNEYYVATHKIKINQ